MFIAYRPISVSILSTGKRNARPNWPLSLGSRPLTAGHVLAGAAHHVRLRTELRDDRARRARGDLAELAAHHGDAAAGTRVRRHQRAGRGEVGAATVDRGVVPPDLVERLERADRQAPVEIQHLHRHQDFLQLGAGTTRRRHVDRVGLVDALDEDALAPVDHLAAEAQLQVGLADVERAVHVGVEQVDVVELLLFLEALVAQLGLRPDVLAGLRDGQAVRARAPRRRCTAGSPAPGRGRSARR